MQIVRYNRSSIYNSSVFPSYKFKDSTIDNIEGYLKVSMKRSVKNSMTENGTADITNTNLGNVKSYKN